MVQRGKEWGKVVGKVVSHKSRTWFKKEARGESTSSTRKGRDKAVEFEQDLICCAHIGKGV